MDHPLSFRILFESSKNDIIEDPENGCYIEPNEDQSDKRQKTNVEWKSEIHPPNYNVVYLQCGKVLRFFNEDGNHILIPEWVVWNPCVRKIIQRIPRSVSKRLRYLSYFKDEEEGYDANDNVLYEFLEDDVYYAYMIEMRLRRAMRNVLARWRCYHMDKKAEPNAVDPITLMEPEKPVVLYSWKSRRKYVFDAKAIALHIETQLLHQDNGFTAPISPRNPWSNVDFTYNELISLYLQIKRYGELRWGLCTLYEAQFDKDRWFQTQHTVLVSKAIKQSIYTITSSYIRESVEEFILSMLEEIGILVTDYHRQIYHLGLLHLQDHWYIQKWKKLCILYYETVKYHLITNFVLVDSARLLIKKQYYLIRALIKAGHLPSSSRMR